MLMLQEEREVEGEMGEECMFRLLCSKITRVCSKDRQSVGYQKVPLVE